MGLGGLWCLPLLGPVAVPVPVKKGLDVLLSPASPFSSRLEQ